MTKKKLLNLSGLVLVTTLIFSPCQCMEKEEESSFSTLPNEMIVAVQKWFAQTPSSHVAERRFNKDSDKDMCIRNTLALVCKAWHEKVIEFTDYIRFPDVIRPLLIDSMTSGCIQIPQIFQNIIRLDANNTIPFRNDIVQDILNFPYLRTLTINFSNTVQDDLVSQLTRLETLKLVSNGQITDKALTPLTDLKRLKLCNQDKVTNIPFQHLKNLERLYLKGCFVVTSSSLSALTRLQTFRLKGTYTKYGVQDEDLANPITLRRLGVYVLSETSLADLVVLPKLTHLTLDGTITISEQAQALYKGETILRYR